MEITGMYCFYNKTQRYFENIVFCGRITER